MKATTRTHEYRQHPLLVTETETRDGHKYYTVTNEIEADYLAENASDDTKNDEAKQTMHYYETEAAAIAAGETSITEGIGEADLEEVREALEDLAHTENRNEAKRGAQRLAQVLASYAKSGDSHRSAEALAEILAASLRGATRY